MLLLFAFLEEVSFAGECPSSNVWQFVFDSVEVVGWHDGSGSFSSENIVENSLMV